MKHRILVFVWTAWCALHSVLITRRITAHLERHGGLAWRYYRLFYNAVAMLALVPVLVYTHKVSGTPIFCWNGWFRLPQGLLLLAARLNRRPGDKKRCAGQTDQPASPQE